MCTYLAQRGSTYYFRRVIPAELRPALRGKSEFMFSLRTKDRAQAKRLIPGYTIETDKQLDAARRQAGLATAVETSPARGRGDALPDAINFEHSPPELGDPSDEAVERYEARALQRAAILKRWNEEHSVNLSMEEAAARDLWREVQEEAELREYVRIHRFAVEQAKMADALPPAIAPSPAQGDTGTSLDTIVERWSAERRVEKKTKQAHQAVATWFYERVGRKSVDEITRKDVIAFKDALIGEGQTPANTVVKLQRLRTLLQWAADNELASGNVATGVNVRDIDRARNRRLPFDLATLNRIFSMPVYKHGARPTQGRGEAAYWLPLLALFTGARLEELGQLRPKDVELRQYPDGNGAMRSAWIILIREDDADDLKLKNAGSERTVPVHPDLERLGFIAFAQAAQRNGQERLFSTLRPNTYGRLTAKWGEWFNPYMRAEADVTDRRMVFHSFRHTFKDYARLSGIPDGIQRQLMGHSSGDVADQYGSGFPLHQLVEGMAQFRVPGLNLPG